MSENVIRSLKFPDNVRQNPSMMLGDLNDSSILLREIFDNSRDELLACPHCNYIWVQTNQSHKFAVVCDNGRGIPVTLSKDEPLISQMELAMGSIFAGGKFDSKEVSGGLHGVGASCINAVSEEFYIACRIWKNTNPDNCTEIVKNFLLGDFNYQGDRFYMIKYCKGIKVEEGVVTTSELSLRIETDLPENMSTITAFIPDDTMVKSTSMKFHESWHEYTFAVLSEFYGRDNISIVVNGVQMTNNWKPLKYKIKKSVELTYPGLNDKVDFLISWDYDTELGYEKWSGSVNMITVNDGLHCKIASWALTNALKNYFDLDLKYLNYGLILNVIVLAKKVGYNSQTKEKLVKISDWYDEDWYKFDDEIKSIFDQNYEEIYKHVQRLIEYNQSIQQLAAKDYIKSMISIQGENISSSRRDSYNPIKLKPCSSADRSECELFLCEGDSAGNAIMENRDTRTQAVLPLKGKSLNTTYKTLEDIFENQEIKDIISAIGMGVDDYNNTENSNYARIIICCDADQDGSHIASLLCGLFAYHMRFIIDKGFLYILESPLFKQGDTYIYPGEEDKLDKTKHFIRFKGLGSLDTPELVQDVLINKETRRLVRLDSEGIERAIRAVGEKSYRKQLMLSNNLIDE